MFKLIKHMKPFILLIVAIVALLFLQAMCDLSLPDYMSNIVNNGIQQGGIENAVPKIIRASEFNKLTLIMGEKDKTEVTANYTLLDKKNLSQNDYDQYVKSYPALAHEPLYKLNTNDKKKIDSLNPIMGKAILVVSGIEKKGLSGLIGAANPVAPKSIQQGIPKGTPQSVTPGGAPIVKIPANIDPFTLIAKIPAAQLDTMRHTMDKKFASMSGSMITQSAVGYIQKEYKAVGMDTNKIQTNYVLSSGLAMLLIALLSLAATVIVGFLAALVAAGLGRNLRKNVFVKVERFSNTEFDKFSTASLITRSTNDIQQIQLLMVMLLRIVFYAPILGVGGVIKALSNETSMGWIIAVAVMTILTVVIVMFAVVIPKFKLVQKLIDKLNLITRESLTGMLVIRAFNTLKHEEGRFDKANTDLTNLNLFVNRIMALMMPVMMLVMNCVTALIVWVGAHQINAGTMQVGNMMAFMQYTMQIIMSFLMISIVSIMLPRASVSAQRIFEVLDTESTINDPKKPQRFDLEKQGYIEFNNVSFQYPGAEAPVLKNITFTAKPGQTTAFIGSTGSGKSTLINLIPRFYDISAGEVLVDGADIREVTQHELRDKIGYVPQRGVLFSGTIKSNLKYSDENASDKDLIKASEIAQAMEFISANREGFDTEISQDGTNVSGGQKQRLSIARALVKKPEIYIFDDSFSALDFKTDAALRKALKTETGNSTVLIVAQRISTIMTADQIIVLDEGKIVGIGTHNELMESCEVYREIALSQLSKEELAS
jgi:ATP-binding cassette subfamily B multidrug efflux pump